MTDVTVASESSSQPMELYSPYLLKRNMPIHIISNSAIKLDLEDGGTIFLAANTPCRYEAPSETTLYPAASYGNEFVRGWRKLPDE
jgi:hypothetical protein